MEIIDAPADWRSAPLGKIVIQVNVTCCDCGAVGEALVSGGEMFTGAFYICANCGARHHARSVKEAA